MNKVELINHLTYFTFKFSKSKLKHTPELDKDVDEFLLAVQDYEKIIGPNYIWNYLCFTFRNLIRNQVKIGNKVYKTVLSKNKLVAYQIRRKEYDFMFMNDHSFYVKYNLSQGEFQRVYSVSSSSSYYLTKKQKFSLDEHGFIKCMMTTDGFSKSNQICQLCQHKHICSKIK